LALFCLLLTGLFISCTSAKDNTENTINEEPVITKNYPLLEHLCDEIKKLIEKDYNSFTFIGASSKSRIEEYYGTYNGCIAVIFNDYFHSGSRPLGLVAGIRFQYDYGNRILAWKEGEFYILQKAFDLGLLTGEDIETIAYYFHNGYVKNRELELFDSFDPSNFDLIIHEPLSEEIKTQIRNVIPHSSEETQIQYYGIYNDAFVFRSLYENVYGISNCEIAADILFVYPNASLYIFKAGKYYSLREAYYTGLISKNDLKNIAYYYNNYREGGIK